MLAWFQQAGLNAADMGTMVFPWASSRARCRVSSSEPPMLPSPLPLFTQTTWQAPLSRPPHCSQITCHHSAGTQSPDPPLLVPHGFWLHRGVLPYPGASPYRTLAPLPGSCTLPTLYMA